MDMRKPKSISGKDQHDKAITVSVGDRVRFDTHSNIGVREDIVRECFIQSDTLGNWFPAVVLTEHSWTPLSSVLDVIRATPKAIQMRRTHKVAGVTVSFSRSIVGWVACFGGSDRCVHFRQPIKDGVWVARRPMALEPLCAAGTLAEAVRLVRARYEAEDREIEARIAAKLQSIAS
jgi:hypothetical protein